MKQALWLLPVVMVAGLIWGAAGCETTAKSEKGAPKMSQPSGMAPPFGGPDDMERAESLWNSMRGYTNWDPYPGLADWQPGKSPHGKVLKYYINSVAARGPEKPGPGSIIVKQNYGREGGPVMAVTVMQKVRGYDPEDGDWFWVKFAPNGEVMKNPKGMNLAGRVAKGMSTGCIACHSNAGGGDFLFANDG